MVTNKNNRRHKRVPYGAQIRISWEDRGIPYFATARCIDLSEEGMRVEVGQPVSPGTMLMVAAENIKFAGAASVRRVDHHGAKYTLGLQLTQAIRAHKISEIEDHLRRSAS
jgi:hypothetical protein